MVLLYRPEPNPSPLHSSSPFGSIWAILSIRTWNRRGLGYILSNQTTKGKFTNFNVEIFTYGQEINLVTSSSLFSPFPCISEKIRANTVSGEEQSSGNGLQLVNIGFTYNPVNLLVYVRSLRTIPHQIYPFVGSTEVDGTCSRPWPCVSYTIRNQKQRSRSLEECIFRKSVM